MRFVVRQFLPARAARLRGAKMTGFFTFSLHGGTISPIIAIAQGIRPERGRRPAF
jgi:hypothetical protein